MLISMRLLKEIIPFDYTADELAKEFSLLGLEVEGIEKIQHRFKNIITAKVNDLSMVEGTKLFKLNAVTGSEKFSVVTRATNLRNGDVVPFAVPNSILANGAKIIPRDFKGIVSNGMLCSYKELGLDGDILSSDEKEGIFILPEDTPIGRPVEDILPIDDEFLEFSLLPDRADAFYFVGIARWIEILKARREKRQADFARFNVDTDIELSGKTSIPIVVENKSLAPFYSGRYIAGVEVKKSLLSIRQKLFMLRTRSINNIVDVTNFVLKFYGQPLHSFDADKLREEVRVRNAIKGEKIKTLDGVERTLNEWNLVIADKERAVALAGVMGGEDTEVTSQTKNVFLESAYFLPSCISKSSRSLNLMTDASMLFEKGTDPEFPEKASLFATKLILKEAGGIAMESNIVSDLTPGGPVNVRIKRIGDLLGESVEKEEVKKYLGFEGFKCIDKGDSLEVHYPSFRRDINIEVDLIEEVLRMKGYNSFGEKPVVASLKSARMTDKEEFLWYLKDEFVRLGLMEVQTVSLISKNLLLKSFISLDNTAEVVNPFSEEMVVLRPSLFPVMLNVAEINKKNGTFDINIFEIGKVFSYQNKKYTERNSVGILLSGNRVSLNPFGKSLPYDFYYLKGIIEEILARIDIKPEFKEEHCGFLHPYQSSVIYINGKKVGVIGTINSNVLKNFDIKQNIYYADLDFEILFNEKNRKKEFVEYPQYPPLKMDIAIVVKRDIPEGTVREKILSVRSEYLRGVNLFDIYQGKPLKDDEKNLAYSLSFYSTDRTLKREEIEEFINELERVVTLELGGKLRKE